MLSLYAKFFSTTEYIPPLSQFAAIFVFGSLILMEALNLVKLKLVSRRERVRIVHKAANLIKASSHVVYDEHPEIEQSTAQITGLQPVPYKATARDSDLAGVIHDSSGNFGTTMKDFQALYFISSYSRIRGCFHKECIGLPGATISLREDDGGVSECVNLGSYNYLNFSQTTYKLESIREIIQSYGISWCYKGSLATSALQVRLEQRLSEFLGTEACIIHSMGFDTNAMAIPCICRGVDEGGTVLICDSLNHASLVSGASLAKRAVGAIVEVFTHDDFDELSALLDKHRGQDIVVIVEGLYSMDGDILELPRFLELRKQYAFKLFVDEAHSIGCLGPTGRGVSDYYNMRGSIDIQMGTFTKSFAAVGGYIAGPTALIDKIRREVIHYNATALIPPYCAIQIQNALDEILHDRARLLQLRKNSIMFRNGLKKIGYVVYGTDDSPVIPVLLYNPVKLKPVADELRRRGIAIVVVGYPAVPLVSSRIRFCISSGHTEEQLRRVLCHMKQMAHLYCMRHGHQKGRNQLIETLKAMLSPPICPHVEEEGESMYF